LVRKNKTLVRVTRAECHLDEPQLGCSCGVFESDFGFA
jgi:hypothetical protein